MSSLCAFLHTLLSIELWEKHRTFALGTINILIHLKINDLTCTVFISLKRQQQQQRCPLLQEIFSLQQWALPISLCVFSQSVHAAVACAESQHAFWRLISCFDDRPTPPGCSSVLHMLYGHCFRIPASWPQRLPDRRSLSISINSLSTTLL